jgi:hypothetical protein
MLKKNMSVTKYFLFITGFFFLLMSCEEAAETTVVAEKSEQKEGVRYGYQDFIFPEFSERAREEVAQWSVFEDFEFEAKTVNGNTIEALRDKSERLMVHTDSLGKKLPAPLFTNPIYSRFNVVNSRVHLLHQEVRKASIDSIQLQQYIQELNIAVKNLIIQINEKFQKEDIDLERKEDEEKELQKQKRFLDSVYRAELQDKKQ